jgi:molybdopterin converting factor small subunit
MVTLLLPAVLAERVSDQHRLQAGGQTVGEVLDDLQLAYPDFVSLLRRDNGVARFMNLYVNDQDVRSLGGLDAPVRNGDTITVLPAVAGG